MEIIHETGSTAMLFYKTKWKKRITPFHWHEKLEFVIPTDHPIGALIDGVWYEAAPKDILVIGAEAIHAFRVDEEESGILLGQFPYGILLTGGTVSYALPPLIKWEEIAADPALAASVSAILEILVREGRVGCEESNPFMQSLCAAFYFLLMRHFAEGAEEPTEKKGKREFYKIVSFVNEHYTEALTVSSIARELYIDRGKLSRLFTTYAGMSLNAYINALRIGRATRLIKEGMGITAAALEAGFQSVRTFHEVFRRTMNAAPRELKK